MVERCMFCTLRVMIDTEGKRASTLTQHFADRGSKNQCKGAARHIIDMVWQCRSPFPVGRRRIIYFFNDFYLLSRRIWGGRISTLCLRMLQEGHFLLSSEFTTPSPAPSQLYSNSTSTLLVFLFSLVLL